MRLSIRRSSIVLAATLALVLGRPTTALAQSPEPPRIEEVQGRIAELEGLPGDGSSDELAGRGQALEDYRQALADLRLAVDARERERRSLAEAAEAAELRESLREELSAAPADGALEIPPDLPLTELESGLQRAQAGVVQARAEVESLDRLASTRSQRLGEIPAETQAAGAALEEARAASSRHPAEADREAQRWSVAARIESASATLAALEAERANLEARRDVLPLRRDRAARHLARDEAAVAAWRARLEERRAAEGAAAEARAGRRLQEVTERFPELEELAERNRELAALRSGEAGLGRRIARAEEALEATRARLADLARRARSAARRIEAGGLTEGMGRTLRRDHESLPRIDELEDEVDSLERELSRNQLRSISLEEEREELGDPVTAAVALVEGLSGNGEGLVEVARELTVARRSALDAAIDELATLIAIQYEELALAAQLIDLLRDYRKDIEEQILWVRSEEGPLSFAVVGELVKDSFECGRAVGESARALDWGALGSGARLRLGAVVLVILLLLAGRGLLRRRRQELGERARSYKTDAYSHTLRALLHSVLLALPLPLAAWALGGLLSAAGDELMDAVGVALRETAEIWLVLRLLKEVTVEKGLGSSHFKWPASSMSALARELRWFEPALLPLAFLWQALDRQVTGDWNETLGRTAFFAGMLLLGLFAFRLVRIHASGPGAARGLLGMTRRLVGLVEWLLPLSLALMAAAGYFYTAVQFEQRLRDSIAFGLLLVLVNALLLRWLFITRRQLAVSQAFEERERRQKEAEDAGDGEASSVPLDADKVDIPAVDAKTRQLFKNSITLATIVGLYFIWASVLPALQGLDRVQLLPTVAVLESDPDDLARETAVSADAATDDVEEEGGSAMPGGVPILPQGSVDSSGESSALGLPGVLTLADLLLALVFLALTLAIARNLPALLELALLQRLPLDGGARYAISTIIRYLVLLIGLGATSNALGIGWSEVQWLAAALTFGLAFGLQEIFANFVSGLIILLERPVRVGDIVSVGGIEGRVTQLRMRATTILDWDRREFLVPNKEFITGSVINWTLSDPVTRIVIPVGIAYGSDTKKARRLLLKIAKDHPLVVDDPPPTAIFRAFGESSLDFQLRVFFANRDLWPELTDRLHSEIDDAFRKAGIEIAFPQRDLHLRSAQGLQGLDIGPRAEPS